MTGAVSASQQGGAMAVKAFFATAGANAAGMGVPALDLHQTGCVFIFGAAYSFFDFAAKNPLPIEETEEPAASAAAGVPAGIAGEGAQGDTRGRVCSPATIPVPESGTPKNL